MKILFLDIETAPNIAHVWGLWNQNIGINQIVEPGYTLCWSAKWKGKSKVLFDGLYYNSQMIKEVWGLLDEADVVVHYNGAKFDIPTLNKEFVEHNLPPPSPYKQMDLLRVTKKQFKFPSNKLDYVAKALGLGQKVKHIGHQLWIDCMDFDPKAWKQMEKYNKQDVVLLEKLYDRLLPWITPHPNYGLFAELDRPVCNNCGSHSLSPRGYYRTNTQIYRRFRCGNCGTWNRSRFSEVAPERREQILTKAV